MTYWLKCDLCGKAIEKSGDVPSELKDAFMTIVYCDECLKPKEEASDD